jgi:phage baseplate assembly protein W
MMANTPTPAPHFSRNFRHPLAVDSGADRLRQQPDYGAHVNAMITQLILTDHGDRVMRPEMGTTLLGLVFEPLRGASATMIRASVFASLGEHLGDIIKVIAVKAEFEESTLALRIVYRLHATPGRVVLNLEVPV